MKIEERVRYLLRLAHRAENEGDERVARAFRRMADEAKPLDAGRAVPALHPALGCCSE